MLIHVVDITHSNAAEQYQTVEDILADLKLDTKPRITVLNKVDIAAGSMEELGEMTLHLKAPSDSIVTISALKGWGSRHNFCIKSKIISIKILTLIGKLKSISR